MSDLYLCGWRVQSDLALPELVPWDGDDRPVDIVIRLGATPERLDGAIDVSPFLQVSQDGRCLLTLSEVATYFVNGPGEVMVDPRAGASQAEVRLFLLGSVLGYLCHIRSLFPLHGSCVAVGGKAIVFSGPSGAGKSTTAAHLARRGHPLIADDVCAIEIIDGVPYVRPAFPRLKLWQDTLDAVGVESAGLERNRAGQQKYHYRHDQTDSRPGRCRSGRSCCSRGRGMARTNCSNAWPIRPRSSVRLARRFSARPSRPRSGGSRHCSGCRLRSPGRCRFIAGAAGSNSTGSRDGSTGSRRWSRRERGRPARILSKIRQHLDPRLSREPRLGRQHPGHQRTRAAGVAEQPGSMRSGARRGHRRPEQCRDRAGATLDQPQGGRRIRRTGQGA
ncbi:hypothetical protein G4G27_10930 [Sphingomonas sp. So64.6b]|nr:hypothetical protein G4G27_10930 [Sphingomonas sp. So64.6b]